MNIKLLPIKIKTMTCTLIGLVLFLIFFLYKGETFLVINDNCNEADAVVVLAGPWEEDKVRVTEGLSFIEKGRCKYLILPIRNERITWKDLEKRYDLVGRVPPKSIIIGNFGHEERKSEKKYGGTFIEAWKAIEIMDQYELHSAIIVSSGYHMRRASLAFSRNSKGKKKHFSFHPANVPIPKRYYWWENNRTLRNVINEYIKLAVALFIY